MALFLASMKVEKHMFFCQKFPSKKVKTITQIWKKNYVLFGEFYGSRANHSQKTRIFR
jgi:hypothetical protein